MTYCISRFTFNIPPFQIARRGRKYLWGVYLFCMLLFLSCQTEKGSYTAVGQSGQCVYSVWKARTAKAAAELSYQITQARKANLHQIPLLTITAAKPIELLPADEEASHWVRVGDAGVDVGKDLYKNVIGGSPELYHSYGFIEGASVEYQTPRLGSQPLILLEIFDMGTPENAFGIYSRNRYPQDEFEWVGSRAIISGRELNFWKGRYFIQIEGYEFASQIKQGMIELAKATAAYIEDPLITPHLLALLPIRNKVPQSEKYFPSGTTLKEIHRSLPAHLLEYSPNVVGCSAAYLHKKSAIDWIDTMIVVVLLYESESEARNAYTIYREYLKVNASQVDSTQEDRIIVREQ